MYGYDCLTGVLASIEVDFPPLSLRTGFGYARFGHFLFSACRKGPQGFTSIGAFVYFTGYFYKRKKILTNRFLKKNAVEIKN